MSTATRAAAKPLTPAQSYQKAEQQQGMLRVGAALGIVLVFVLPLIPSPIAHVDWRTPVWNMVKTPLLLVPLDQGPAVVQVPVLVWLYRVLAVFLGCLSLSLLMHLQSLYVQRTKPLTVVRSYLRLRVPLQRALRPEEGIGLLRIMHGIAPPPNPLQGGGVPLVLRWTGRPEMPVAQGVSMMGTPTTIIAIRNTLKAISRGTNVTIEDDPLRAACTAGRLVGWADVRMTGPSDLPIAPASKDTPVLAALLPALAPQAGIVMTDVQILLAPVPDRSWRIAVRGRMERMKSESDASERRALEAKSAGPAYAMTMRLIAVGEQEAAVTAQIMTMAATLAGTAQTVGTAQQRLVAGAVQVLPAVLPPPPAVPRLLHIVSSVVAVLLVLGGLVGVWRSAVVGMMPLVWAFPVLVGIAMRLLPVAWWRKRTNVMLPARLATVLCSVPLPRNPRCIPLWHPWFGYQD